jgi:DDE superfamily endonuclease/Helix-turn-helix of DDE superfamily endonuclease
VEPQLEEVFPQIIFARGPHVIAYPAMLDLPTELVSFLAELLAAERRTRGTRPGTRKLTCEQQALFALVWFRERRAVALIGKGLGISQATAYRYLDEAIEVLAARAPDLHTALARGVAEGWSHVILDGKVVETDRLRVKKISTKGKTIDAWYCGKTHDFGGNIQALMRPDGLPIWISPVEPGSVHDLTAARAHVLGALYAAAGRGLPTLADPGYEGAGIGVHTPARQPANGAELNLNTRARTALLRSLRALGERGFALLVERWRALQHVTLSPSKISKIARAALVLTHFEHNYLAW